MLIDGTSFTQISYNKLEFLAPSILPIKHTHVFRQLSTVISIIIGRYFIGWRCLFVLKTKGRRVITIIIIPSPHIQFGRNAKRTQNIDALFSRRKLSVQLRSSDDLSIFHSLIVHCLPSSHITDVTRLSWNLNHANLSLCIDLSLLKHMLVINNPILIDTVGCKVKYFVCISVCRSLELIEFFRHDFVVDTFYQDAVCVNGRNINYHRKWPVFYMLHIYFIIV